MTWGRVLLVVLGCSCGCGRPAASSASVTVDGTTAVAEVNSAFLSVAIDSAEFLGGTFFSPNAAQTEVTGSAQVPPYDFSRPRLRALAHELSPAFLRIGGSDADRTFYDLNEIPVPAAPAPYRLVLTRSRWNDAMDFARLLGAGLFFTLNAGPGPRDVSRAWTPDMARALIRYAQSRGDKVALWELGNEINGFQAVHGVGFRIDGNQYARDVRAARRLLDEESPGSSLAGPSSAFWPVVGELAPVFPDFMSAGGGSLLSVVTWHYYPQQSRRCPLQIRRAGPDVLLDPRALNDIREWAAEVHLARQRDAPQAQVWMGETGNAQCGGEPGVSDRWAGALWWLDELGTLARLGEPVVVRQTLSGSNYGLLDDVSLDPRPDYWASVLWKRLIGERILNVQISAGAQTLRAYAACTASVRSGAVTLLFINLDSTQAVAVDVRGIGGGVADFYGLTSDGLTSQTVRLNGQILAAADDGALPALAPTPTGALVIAPLSSAFVVFPNAGAQACN